MSQTTIFIVLLIANVVLIGALGVVALQHARAHLKQKKATTEPLRLPPAAREKLLAQSEKQFENILARSRHDLEEELTDTGEKLSTQLDKMGSQIIAEEMVEYRGAISQLEAEATAAIEKSHKETAAAQDEIDKLVLAKQAELEIKLTKDIADKKKQLTEKIETSLNDAVLSLLLETLGHNVDLGAQEKYLLETLEAHKEELKQGVTE